MNSSQTACEGDMVTPLDERRESLRRKYLSLGVGELLAAAVFIVAIASVDPRLRDGEEQRALWSALVPLLVIVVQGGGYWLLARSWVELRVMPIGLARVYRTFRVLDPLILVAGLVGVIAWTPHRPLVAALVFGVWAFGVIEFVNYYVVRLAYPPSQWVRSVGERRKPRLVVDLTRT